MNSEEICQMAAWQDEVGQHCVTGVVSLAVSDEGSDVHFEAFQVLQKNTQKTFLLYKLQPSISPITCGNHVTT